MKLSRRDFLKNAAALSAAALVPPVFVETAQAYDNQTADRQAYNNVVTEGSLEAAIYKSPDPQGDTVIEVTDYNRQVGRKPYTYLVKMNPAEERVSIYTVLGVQGGIYPFFVELHFNPEDGSHRLTEARAETPRHLDLEFNDASPEVQRAKCDIKAALDLSRKLPLASGYARPIALPEGGALYGVTTKDRETQIETDEYGESATVSTRFFHPKLPIGGYGFTNSFARGWTTIEALGGVFEKAISQSRDVFLTLSANDRLYVAETIALALAWDTHKTTSATAKGPEQDGWFKLNGKRFVRAPRDMVFDPKGRDPQGSFNTIETTINKRLDVCFSQLLPASFAQPRFKPYGNPNGTSPR